MSEVVFLSNTNIQIATGSGSSNGVKVSKLISAPLPEGAMLNGVVMDEDVVTEAIKLAWAANRLPKSEVTLIIASPQLRANRVDAPLQSDKKTTAFIGRETSNSDYGRFQKPVTGWYVVSKDNKSKTQHVVYETAEQDFVDTYVRIFEKAGLKLKSIHNGVQLVTEFFTNQAAGKTVLYMILDGKSLVTIFFSEGKYYYDSTSRIFSQPGTAEFAREIYASVSSIRQFISAQHLTENMNSIYFAGLTQSQLVQLSNDIVNIDSALDISMVTPPSGTSVAKDQTAFPYYVYPIAGLRKIDEKLPILKAKVQDRSNTKKNGGFSKLIALFIVVAVIVAGVYGALLAVKASKKAQLKEIEKYINDPKVIAKVNKFDAMYKNMGDMGKIQGGVDILRKYIDSYPLPDSSVNERILEAADKYNVEVSFDSYSASTGVFNITASAPEVNDVNVFIAELMDMDDIFESVDYTGYSVNKDETGWIINVVCTLAARNTDQNSSADSASVKEVK